MPNEIRVNGYQSNWQRSPEVTVLADGSSIIVWESYLNNYDDTDVRLTYIGAQRFSAEGQPIGPERVISQAINNSNSNDPSIAALDDGGYVVSWSFDDYDDILTLDTNVYAKVYNADDTVRRDTFLVDRLPTQEADLSEVIARSDGGFSIAYHGDTNGNMTDTFVRNYNAQGIAQGPDRVLSVNSNQFDETTVDAARLSNGKSVLIWNSEGGLAPNDSSERSNALRATILNADGSVWRSDFVLTENLGGVGSSFGFQFGPGYDVAGLNDGGFVISYRPFASDIGLDSDLNPIVMRFFNNAGNATSAPIVGFQTDQSTYDTTITQLDTGEIVLVWEQRPLNTDAAEDIYARVFTATGSPITGVFEVGGDNDAPLDDQTDPRIAALNGGGYVITHQSESIDNDDEGISATFFGVGAPGNDVATVGPSGNLTGGAGNDRLTGDGRVNWLSGGTGNDLLYGLGGNDALYGGSGRDFLGGGGGADLMNGGTGNDRYIVDNRGDTVGGEIGFFVGGGIDTVLSFVSYTLPRNVEILRLMGTADINGGGGFAPESLVGNAGSNRLNGGGGTDQINGKAGNDVLIGALGADTLVGEGGADIFRFNSVNDSRAGANNRDFINGFQHGQDRINLFEIDANWNVGGNQAYRFIGDDTFSGAAGEVRFFTFGSGNFNIVEADNNGDRQADLQIFVNQTTSMSAGDFIL